MRDDDFKEFLDELELNKIFKEKIILSISSHVLFKIQENLKNY
tara:strand:+ start:2186 stop:2314 length:129 start_codon:yes stop_codon:yes gene_type:complete